MTGEMLEVREEDGFSRCLEELESLLPAAGVLKY
jgi:hypothetical protein